MASNNMVDIDSPYILTPEQIEFFAENRFIKLKNVFNEETLNYYRKEIWEKTFELNSNNLPMEERDTYGKAFIQVVNLWRNSTICKEFVMGQKVAKIAAELMAVDGVRLYHDQALFKEKDGGITPWHCDQQYWPLSTDKTITAWIPLQPVTMEMGPLSFAPGSHKNTKFRGLEISDESEKEIRAEMESYDVDSGIFDLGEISFHSGWLYHRAPPNTSEKTRGVFTIIYMDKNMRLKEPENCNQVNDRNAFLPNVEIGNICDSLMNPVIYQK